MAIAGGGQTCDWWAHVGLRGVEAAADRWSILVTHIMGEYRLDIYSPMYIYIYLHIWYVYEIPLKSWEIQVLYEFFTTI